VTETDGAKRLFIGAHVSLGAVEDIVGLVESMQPLARSESLKVRWLAPATYHITLKFLGWAKAEIVPALVDALDDAFVDLAAFTVSLRGVGAFPSEKKARVLWVGVDQGKSELAALAGRIETRMVELGFPAENRAFHPHVTIARLKDPANAETLVLPFSEDTFRKTKVEQVVLFESITGEKGAEYHALEAWPLGPARAR